MAPLRPLTAAERDALRQYARRYGRTWKGRLSEDWYHARLTGPLHALRNSHGPAWLDGYRLPALPEVDRRCAGCGEVVGNPAAHATCGRGEEHPTPGLVTCPTCDGLGHVDNPGEHTGPLFCPQCRGGGEVWP